MAVRSVVIPPEAEGMKAENFLRRLMPDLPESILRKVFSARDVKVDGIRIMKNTLVHSGQKLIVFFPSRPDSAESLRVVWENDDILLINKPSGVSVEADNPGDLCLTDLCRIRAESNSSGPVIFPPAACHRLDNKTSGLCLFAKNEYSLQILQESFRNRTVEKYYTCLVRGIMKPPAAVCTAWLLKDSTMCKVKILDHETPGARPITTGYETIIPGPVSRLRVHLITGRTHQIRAHLAALGHPVLGDDLYGNRSFDHQQKVRSLRLCATEMTLHTNGKLPDLDNRTFIIEPPF